MIENELFETTAIVACLLEIIVITSPVTYAGPREDSLCMPAIQSSADVPFPSMPLRLSHEALL